MQKRSETRSMIQQRRYEAMSANRIAKEQTVKTIKDAKSLENVRQSAMREQRKVDKLRELIQRNKARKEYDMLLENKKHEVGSAYSVRQ